MQTLRATPRRKLIEGKRCEYEREVAEGVVTAEHMNGNIADVDRMVKPGRGPVTKDCESMRAARWSTDAERDSRKQNYTAKKTVSTMKTRMNTYLTHTECRSRGSRPDV